MIALAFEQGITTWLQSIKRYWRFHCRRKHLQAELHSAHRRLADPLNTEEVSELVDRVIALDREIRQLQKATKTAYEWIYLTRASARAHARGVQHARA